MILISLGILIVIWAGIFMVDYSRANDLKMPIFVWPTDTADDGGSGTYQGFGYYFEIEGNFMPADVHSGIVRIDLYLFGNHFLGVIT